MGVSNPRAQLPESIPGGIALDGVYVGPSVAAALDGAVGAAIETGTWADALPLLPSVLSAGDAAALLGTCPALRCAKSVEGEPATQTAFHRAITVWGIWFRNFYMDHSCLVDSQAMLTAFLCSVPNLLHVCHARCIPLRQV